MTGPHLGFILASYAIGVSVLTGLIVWAWADWRLQTRALERLARSDAARRRPRP